ncbi:hypothetical protein [Lysinibacillus fusiformis]|uniref:hypothetical protein n=1 Tax=Lysinibacillus fusiformis TaxID=28031 RepID=UPI003CFFACB1
MRRTITVFGTEAEFEKLKEVLGISHKHILSSEMFTNETVEYIVLVDAKRLEAEAKNITMQIRNKWLH